MDPSFDLVARLRSRRLRWAGHILRLEEASLIRRLLIATVERDLEEGKRHAGGLMEDAPVFKSVEQLLELAADEDGWRVSVLDLLPDSDPTPGKAEKRERKARKETELWKNGKAQKVSDAFMVGAGYHLVGEVWTLGN